MPPESVLGLQPLTRPARYVPARYLWLAYEGPQSRTKAANTWRHSNTLTESVLPKVRFQLARMGGV